MFAIIHTATDESFFSTLNQLKLKHSLKQAVGGRPPRYSAAPCKLTIYSYLFARWHLFRHVGYLRHQQQIDRWPFELESGVRVTCEWRGQPLCQFQSS